MNYEKKYKEALERAKKLKENPKAIFLEEDNVHVSDYIFPELAESEDERIRKDLIDYLRANTGNNRTVVEAYVYKKWADWLEKQGKPNPYSGTSFDYNGHTWGMCARDNGVEILVDGVIKERVFLDNKPQGKSTLETVKDEKVENTNKVKPKFEFDFDDWVVTDKGDTVQIVSVNNSNYTLYNRMKFDISYVDKFWHKWTIKDAKAGDVLATVDDGNPFIYKGCLDPEHPNSPVAYCGLDLKGELCVNSRKQNHWWTDTTVHPATKEQRDLLFQKMYEAGYEWDEEKKELKKIASDNAEQEDRYLGWLKKDADMLDFLMALFKDTFPNMTFHPLAHMDRKELITSKDIVNWLYDLRPNIIRVVDYNDVWHDATKELPPKRNGFDLSKDVLVYDQSGDVFLSSYDYEEKSWRHGNVVSHWAYLPQPPKTD